jgi:phage/plasmid-associated DNA primase
MASGGPIAQPPCSRSVTSACRAVESRKKAKDKEKLGAFSFVSQLERRLRPLLASEPHEWDADPMLLNTPGPWTINLETGEKRESRREDNCTKSTAVGPMGKCPLWMTFLERIFEGDQERIRFIQRMAGYCATGSTQEQCLFFLFGTGQNGKGTLVHTLNYVLKDYVANTAIETFAGGKFERHPEELAVLRGARMVLGSETTGRGRLERRPPEAGHRRRSGPRPLHAHKLVRICAALQAGDLRQSPAHPCPRSTPPSNAGFISCRSTTGSPTMRRTRALKKR